MIERTLPWLTGYRRLNHRYERKPGNYLAFLGLAAALCCYKRCLKLTMQDTVLDGVLCGDHSLVRSWGGVHGVGRAGASNG